MKSSHRTPPKAAVDASEIGDDMVDASEDLPSCPALREAIEFATDTLLARYQKADGSAIGQQKWHRRATMAAAISGTLAVLLAILELSKLSLYLAKVENLAVVMAILSGAAVTLGLISHFQRGWLLDRHKAERYRLLKFGLITDAKFWCSEAEQKDRRDQLQKDARSVSNMKFKDLRRWLKNERMVESPVIKKDCRVDDKVLHAIVDYYRRTRLEKQKRFFECRIIEHQARKKKRTRGILPLLFFGSVFAAFLHFVAAWRKIDENHAVMVILLLLAAGLPALGAGIRTYRSANEFARNTMRYEAKLIALQRHEKGLVFELAQKLDDHDDQIIRILHDFRWCEQIFDLEHREWLRLMLEADWYG